MNTIKFRLILIFSLAVFVSSANAFDENYIHDGVIYKPVGYNKDGLLVVQGKRGGRSYNFVVPKEGAKPVRQNIRWSEFYSYYEETTTDPKTGKVTKRVKVLRSHWARDTVTNGKITKAAPITTRKQLRKLSPKEVGKAPFHGGAAYMDKRISGDVGVSAGVKLRRRETKKPDRLGFTSGKINADSFSFAAPTRVKDVPDWKDSDNARYAKTANDTWAKLKEGMSDAELEVANKRVLAIRQEIKKNGWSTFSPQAKELYMSTLSDIARQRGQHEIAASAEQEIYNNGQISIANEFRRKHAKKDYEYREKELRMRTAAKDQMQKLRALAKKAEEENWPDAKKQKIIDAMVDLKKKRKGAIAALREGKFDSQAFKADLDKSMAAVGDEGKKVVANRTPRTSGQKISALDGRIDKVLAKVSRTGPKSSMTNEYKDGIAKKLKGYKEEISKLKGKDKLTPDEKDRLAKLEQEVSSIETMVDRKIAEVKDGNKKDQAKHKLAALKKDPDACARFIYGLCAMKGEKSDKGSSVARLGKKPQVAKGEAPDKGQRVDSVALSKETTSGACEIYNNFVGKRIARKAKRVEIAVNHAKSQIKEKFGKKCELATEVDGKFYLQSGLKAKLIKAGVESYTAKAVGSAQTRYKEDHKTYSASTAVRSDRESFDRVKLQNASFSTNRGAK